MLKFLCLFLTLMLSASADVCWNIAFGELPEDQTWNRLTKGETLPLKAAGGAATTVKARLWVKDETRSYVLEQAHPLLATGLEGHVVVAFHDLKPASTVEITVYVAADADTDSAHRYYQIGAWRWKHEVASGFPQAALVPGVNVITLAPYTVPASGRVTFLLVDYPPARIAALQLKTKERLSTYTP